jgi:hypothetical protein
MNVYSVGMPVKTPINDDLVFGTSIEDDWYNFCNAVAIYPFGTCDKKPPKTVAESTYTIPASLTEDVTMREIAMAPDEFKTADAIRNIDIAVQSYSLQRATETAQLQTQKEADQSIGFFNPLDTELRNMNGYFLNFSNILESLHQKVESIPQAGNPACTEIKNKKECE